MRLLFLLTILPAFLFCQDSSFDLVIKNGKVIDGSGNSWYYADVAIKNGKITLISKNVQPGNAKVIDATGLIVAPGFIDVHTHIEGDEIKTPTADNFILDGVTSVVTGNCGASKIEIADYFRFIDSLRLSVNVATLVGHNDIRRAVMGNANRAPGEAELGKMELLVAN